MLMPLLLDAINASEALAAGIAAVHFLSTQAGDILITLIYAAARGHSAVVLCHEWLGRGLALSPEPNPTPKPKPRVVGARFRPLL